MSEEYNYTKIVVEGWSNTEILPETLTKIGGKEATRLSYKGNNQIESAIDFVSFDNKTYIIRINNALDTDGSAGRILSTFKFTQ